MSRVVSLAVVSVLMFALADAGAARAGQSGLRLHQIASAGEFYAL